MGRSAEDAPEASGVVAACARTRGDLDDAPLGGADASAWARAGRHAARIGHEMSAAMAMRRVTRLFIDPPGECRGAAGAENSTAEDSPRRLIRTSRSLHVGSVRDSEKVMRLG